ncbi:MAG TPA: P-loop NTPase [Methylocella sp.]|nr:P-loop NTPase [Methylocella sp.]
MLDPETVLTRPTQDGLWKYNSTPAAPYRYILFLTWHRRYTILVSLGTMLFSALCYVILTSAHYTATTTMVLDTSQSPIVQADNKGDPKLNDNTLQSQVETIKSDNVVSAVVKELKLADDPEFTKTFSLLWLLGSGSDASADSAEGSLHAAAEAVKTGLKVELIPKSNAVDISFTSKDRKKAVAIANAIARAYIEDQLQARFELTKRARLWLQQGIAELKDAASTAFKSVQDFKSQNNLLVSGDGKLAKDVEIQQLTESLAKSRAETTLAQSRLADITGILSTQASDDAPEGTVTDALNNAVITKLRQQYLDDERLANEFSTRYGVNHQTVVKLKAKLADIKREIRDEEERIAETYKSDLKIAQSREQAIEKRLSELFQSGRRDRQSQVKLRELETAENTYRSVYEDFLNRYTQAVQQQSFPSIEARVITPAFAAKKTSPGTGMVLLIAAAAGLNLGAGIVFLREQLSRPIYTRDQLARQLGVNCIAVFPLPTQQRSTYKLTSLLPPPLKRLAASHPQKKVLEQVADLPMPLYADEDPYSANSESLRNIEVTINLRSATLKTRSVAVVSCLAGEGKSSIALSLATTLARASHQVALVDFDFRNPSLTRFLGFQDQPGVLELVSGQAKLADLKAGGGRYGFDFLCAPTTVRPARIACLLQSEAMSNFFSSLEHYYEYIIADLPPILPVIDVRACAHLFDAFAFVAEWGKTSVDDLDRAFHTAPLVHERLLGVILNKVDEEEARLIEGPAYAAYGYYA